MDQIHEIPKRPRQKVPVWQEPARFPEWAASILQRSKLTKSQSRRFQEQLLLFYMANLSADWVISSQKGIRKRDKADMERFAKIIGLLKNDSAVTVNMQNNHLSITQGASGDKSFDSIVRMLDERDRRENSIETTAVPVIEGPENPDLDE